MKIKLFNNGKAFPAYKLTIKNLIKALWAIHKKKADVLIIGDVISKNKENKKILIIPDSIPPAVKPHWRRR